MNDKSKSKSKKKNGRQVTRGEIAKAAGVSVTTVTHALNPPKNVSMKPSTRDRVLRVADELGYRPSFAGRALVSGKTFSVGLLQQSHRMLAYDVHNSIIRSIILAAERDEFHLLLLPLSESERWLKPIQQGRVDGVFVVQSFRKTGHVEQILKKRVPVVVVNATCPVGEGKPVCCIHSDHRGMVQRAVDCLVEHGAKSIMAMHDPEWSDGNRQLQEQFVDLAKQYSGRGVVGSILVPSLDEAGFRQQLRALISAGQHWDAFLVDRIAGADIVIDEMARFNRKAGVDYQLVSVSNGERFDTPNRPELAILSQDLYALGHAAWDTMHALINGEGESEEVTIPYKMLFPAAMDSAKGSAPIS